MRAENLFKNWLPKSFQLVLLLFIFLLAVSDSPRLYEGYCPEIGRSMTEKEKIIAALDQSNTSHKVLVADKENGAWVRNSSLIRYKSGREIYDNFPDCCFVEYKGRMDGKSRAATEGMSTEPLRKSGNYAGHVILMYEAPYIAEDGTKRTARVRQTMMITNCGEYWSYT
jgi:hypothetical protein